MKTTIILSLAALSFGFVAVDLSSPSLPYSGDASDGFAALSLDAEGLPVIARPDLGLGVVKQPYNLASYGISCLNAYLADSEPEHLTHAELCAGALLRDSDMVGAAMLFPYNFDFALHGGPDVVKAPWYSGLAQGKALSLFVRLWAVTGRPDYYEDARAIFASFGLRAGEADPWITDMVGGRTWFEEYPIPGGTQVLNGHCVAVFGLYDYWRFTADPEALALLTAGINTIRETLPLFRRPGQMSNYWLRDRDLCDAYYQEKHAEYCLDLWHITREQIFLDYANGFAADLEAVRRGSAKAGSGGGCFIGAL